MSESFRASRSSGVVLAVALIFGLAVSWWIFDRRSPNDGSRPAAGAPAALDESGTAPTRASEPGASGVQGGETADLGVISAGAGTEGVGGEGTRPEPRPAAAEAPLEAARPSTQAARAEGRDSSGTNPEIDDAAGLEERARHARTLGRLDDAVSYLELALSQKEEHLGPDHPSVAQTLGQLAGVYAEQGRDED